MYEEPIIATVVGPPPRKRFTLKHKILLGIFVVLLATGRFALELFVRDMQETQDDRVVQQFRWQPQEESDDDTSEEGQTPE